MVLLLLLLLGSVFNAISLNCNSPSYDANDPITIQLAQLATLQCIAQTVSNLRTPQKAGSPKSSPDVTERAYFQHSDVVGRFDRNHERRN